MSGSKSKRYPVELRERAVRMAAEIGPEHESEWAAMSKVAQLLGVGTVETVRKWCRQAQVDAGGLDAVVAVGDLEPAMQAGLRDSEALRDLKGAGMSTSRFCRLIDMSERTWRRWQAKARAGPPVRRSPVSGTGRRCPQPRCGMSVRASR